MATLLITGGAGFIGSNFIHYWLGKYPADKIINLDKLTYSGNLANLESIENNFNYKFIKGDIGETHILDEILPKVDLVVNFAAESHVDNSITGPQVFLQTNILSTQVLLDACIRHNIKHFHHISTDEVFGELELDTKDKFNEDSNYDPRSPYSASKAASDHLVRAYGNTYGLNYTITNCSNNFGPYQHPEKFIPRAITNVLMDKQIPIYGDGKYIRDWLYVDDHCNAIDLVIKKGDTNSTYCIGGNADTFDNLAIANMILKLLDKDESYIEFVKDRPGHDRRYAIDFSKAQADLGYKPASDFDEGLKKTVQWYKENESWWKSLVAK